jgi:hypothetical protein
VLLAAAPASCFAAEPGSAPSTEATTDTGSQSSAAPTDATSDQDTQAEKSGDKKDSDGNLMRNVTRHRPGACPEGPPFKSED